MADLAGLQKFSDALHNVVGSDAAGFVDDEDAVHSKAGENRGEIGENFEIGRILHLKS